MDSRVPPTLVRRDFFPEAANTLKAGRWTLFMARLFGEHVPAYDTMLREHINLVRWRGVMYMLYAPKRRPPSTTTATKT